MTAVGIILGCLMLQITLCSVAIHCYKRDARLAEEATQPVAVEQLGAVPGEVLEELPSQGCVSSVEFVDEIDPQHMPLDVSFVAEHPEFLHVLPDEEHTHDLEVELEPHIISPSHAWASWDDPVDLEGLLGASLVQDTSKNVEQLQLPLVCELRDPPLA